MPKYKICSFSVSDHNPPEPSPVTNHPSDAQIMADIETEMTEKQTRHNSQPFKVEVLVKTRFNLTKVKF